MSVSCHWDTVHGVNRNHITRSLTDEYAISAPRQLTTPITESWGRVKEVPEIIRIILIADDGRPALTGIPDP